MFLHWPKYFRFIGLREKGRLGRDYPILVRKGAGGLPRGTDREEDRV